MKILGLTALLALPTYSAVTTLPAAPTGFEWELVTSGQFDSNVVDVSGVDSDIATSLGLSGSTTAPFSATSSGSSTATLTAFGAPEPSSYSIGDTVDLVTSNTYAATLNVSNTAGVQNADTPDLIIVESKLSNVQISSPLGASAPGAIVESAIGNGPVVFVTPNASVTVSQGGSFSQVQGELITFTFDAADELAVTKPFGGANSNNLTYFVNSTANASLRRDTVYDTYELVAIVPEPSSISLLVLSALGLAARRRRS